MQENKRIRQVNINSMKTLVQLSKGIILNSLYPTVCLQVSYANALHKVAKSKWMQEAKIPLTVIKKTGAETTCRFSDLLFSRVQ